MAGNEKRDGMNQLHYHLLNAIDLSRLDSQGVGSCSLLETLLVKGLMHKEPRRESICGCMDMGLLRIQ